jgi:hypothetical protein
VIRRLQLGRPVGRIGIWGNLSVYLRNLTIEEISPRSLGHSPSNLQQLALDTFLTEWTVSAPYPQKTGPYACREWTKAFVEENGVLNINRLYSADKTDTAVQAASRFLLPAPQPSVLSLGYSDDIRLWINDTEVHHGTWIWDPPHSDGRIHHDQVTIPVRWRAGENMVRAELVNVEGKFGWGLSLKTGLSNLSLAHSQGIESDVRNGLHGRR